MVNISFKAQIAGLPSEKTHIKEYFEEITKYDDKHSVEIVSGPYKNDPDSFILRKNGVVTVKNYVPEFLKVENKEYTPRQLVSIYNTLKALEAKNVIKKSAYLKQQRDSKAELDKMEDVL